MRVDVTAMLRELGYLYKDLLSMQTKIYEETLAK